MEKLDKFRGCLIGGAAGDALGYEVEFFSEPTIFDKFGKCGITEYAVYNGKACISDDTQMTLFTANALVLGAVNKETDIQNYSGYINNCYKDWLRTQLCRYPVNHPEAVSCLLKVPDLFSRRAPGNSCLSALNAGGNGTLENPINNSKGCGGVMRVAPIGIFFDPAKYDIADIAMLGAQASALTHGHELGYIPSAMLVYIINLLTYKDGITLHTAVDEALEATKVLFPAAYSMEYFVQLMEKAIALSGEDMADLDAIHQLGEGWVADETLAIAVYCALKYENDFDKALIAAVNHCGDSDSTGAVTGNILGAYLGLSNIPEKYLAQLELKEVIIEISNDLFMASAMDIDELMNNKLWTVKYANNK